MRPRQLFYRVLIASLIAIASMAIVAILKGDFADTDVRILGTIFTIVLYSWTTYAQSRLLERRPELVLLAIAGLVVSAVGFMSALIPIWGDSGSDDAWRTAFIALVLAFALGDIALVLSSRRASDSPATMASAAGTIATVSVLAAMLVAAILNNGDYGQSYYRLMAVVGVLWVLGTVLTPILRRAHGVRSRRPLDARDAIDRGPRG